MLISIVFFTVNTLAVRALALAIPACDGWVVTLFRGLAGTMVVVLLYSKAGQLRLKSLLDRPKVIARGILGAVGVSLYYITVIELGAARAVVINLTYPIFAAVLARVLLKESLSAKKLFWILSGFLGLMIFLAPKALDSGVGLYDILALVGAVMAAGVVVLIRKLHQSEHGSTIFASQAVYCAVLAAPITQGQPLTLPNTAILLLFAAGLIVAAGQLTMTFAYRHLEVSKGASLQLLLPIATGIGAWLFFGETFGAIELLGAALTLFATMMINRRASKTFTKKLTTQPIRS
jgi:drug/metabolite transporter (DMT)-like permease